MTSNLLFFSMEIHAKELGKIGTTYKIQEEDSITLIQRKLMSWKKKGGAEKLKKEMISKAKSFWHRPPSSVPYILDATKNSTRLYDPSYTFPKSIYNHKNQLIAYKGQVVNPLDYMPLNEELIFINGDNDKQVAWALQEYKRRNEKYYTTKIILIRGSWLDISQKAKVRMYFDLYGRLSKKFELSYVPSVLTEVNSKKGKRIQIQEILVDDEELTKYKKKVVINED